FASTVAGTFPRYAIRKDAPLLPVERGISQTTIQRGRVEHRRGRSMKFDKCIGFDLHRATTVVAVLDREGKVVLETIVATEAAPIIRFLQSLSGPLHVTFEETTEARWMYDVVRSSEGAVADGQTLPGWRFHRPKRCFSVHACSVQFKGRSQGIFPQI